MTKQPNADLIYIAASDKASKELRDIITNALNALQRARVLTSSHRDTADKAARELDDIKASSIKSGTTALIDNKNRLDLSAAVAKIADKQHAADQARDAYKLAETIENKVQTNARRITIEHRGAIIQWIAQYRAADIGADGVVVPVQVREIHDSLGVFWYPRHDQDLELSPLYYNGQLHRVPLEWHISTPSMVRASCAWLWQQVALGNFIIVTDGQYRDRIKVTATVEQLPTVKPTPAQYLKAVEKRGW
jgi:hypothetical protein